MIGDAFNYPLNVDHPLGHYLIGSLLIIGSFLILPAFVLLGYFTTAIQHAMRDEEPPEFENFLTLFVRGLKLVVVTIAYLVLFIVLVFLALFAVEIGGAPQVILFVFVLVPGYFGLIYIGTSVLYHFCRKQSVIAHFALGASSTPRSASDTSPSCCSSWSSSPSRLRSYRYCSP